MSVSVSYFKKHLKVIRYYKNSFLQAEKLNRETVEALGQLTLDQQKYLYSKLCSQHAKRCVPKNFLFCVVL